MIVIVAGNQPGLCEQAFLSLKGTPPYHPVIVDVEVFDEQYSYVPFNGKLSSTNTTFLRCIEIKPDSLFNICEDDNLLQHLMIAGFSIITKF